MKKIAIIGLKGLPAFGGAARSMEEVIKCLSEDFNFTIYEIDSHAQKGYNIPNVRRIIFKSLRIKRFNTLIYYIKSTIHVLIFEKFDLIHTNHLYCGFIIPLLKLKYKVINTVHGIIPKDDIKWNRLDKIIFKFFELLAVRFSNKLITVSKPHISYLKKYKEREIIYIPNGITVQENIISNDGKYILFAAARILKLKGLHTLIEALKKINYKDKVIILGDLEHSLSYKKQILEISIGLDIEFKGLVKNRYLLFNYIRESRLFVFPSFNEGMSNMLLEVASLKTPIVCSDIEENKAIFNDDEVLFFSTGNTEHLGEKILWAAANMGLMKCKAINAYKKLALEYSWTKIAQSYKNLYLSLMSNHND